MHFLNFLIDTNVVIALDPLSVEVDEDLSPAARFLRRAQEGNHRVFVHPAADADLVRDRNEARRRVRQALQGKYRVLTDPPAVRDEFLRRLGTPPTPGGNNDVDNQHLAALDAEAVVWLVTEDGGLHRKAKRLGLGERVLSIAEAADLLERLSPGPPVPPLAVQARKAYALDLNDPFFDSLREDYPEFDDWFRSKCCREQRDAFVVQSPDQNRIVALCILKEEGRADGHDRPTLKLSTFKVASEHSGLRYGELLLRSVFEHCRARGLISVYVEVFAEKQPRLEALLDDFGFEPQPERTRRGETILRKELRPPAGAEQLDLLEYHKRFGPGQILLRSGQVMLVPVQPQWHEMLFPDAAPYWQPTLEPEGLGHGLRKAYLCRAPIRTIRPGAILLFYRSRDAQEVRVVGVVETATVLRTPEEIAARVGKRTVYTLRDIEEMCARGEVLVIMFRHDRILDPPITLEELRANANIAPPQSITTLPKEAVEWLRPRLNT